MTTTINHQLTATRRALADRVCAAAVRNRPSSKSFSEHLLLTFAIALPGFAWLSRLPPALISRFRWYRVDYWLSPCASRITGWFARAPALCVLKRIVRDPFYFLSPNLKLRKK